MLVRQTDVVIKEDLNEEGRRGRVNKSGLAGHVTLSVLGSGAKVNELCR